MLINLFDRCSKSFETNHCHERDDVSSRLIVHLDLHFSGTVCVIDVEVTATTISRRIFVSADTAPTQANVESPTIK